MKVVLSYFPRDPMAAQELYDWLYEVFPRWVPPRDCDVVLHIQETTEGDS